MNTKRKQPKGHHQQGMQDIAKSLLHDERDEADEIFDSVEDIKELDFDADNHEDDYTLQGRREVIVIENQFLGEADVYVYDTECNGLERRFQIPGWMKKSNNQE